MSYYGYQKRKPEEIASEVNWAKIGLDISDRLKSEADRRETLKSEIDKASSDFSKTISAAPMGEDAAKNKLILSFATQAQEARLLQDNLLKSGRLSLRDYTIMRQNLADGAASAFSLAKEYNAVYAEVMDRMRKDSSHPVEAFIMEKLERYANPINSGLHINPKDYSVYVGTNDDKGRAIGLEDVSNLKKMLAIRVDKYNFMPALKNAADAMGRYSEQKGWATGSETFSSIMLKAGYPEAEKNYINSLLGNDMNASSVLLNYKKTDEHGRAYELTDDESKAKENPNMILVKTKPGSYVPEVVLTEDQRKESYNVLRDQFRVMLDAQFSEQKGVKASSSSSSATPKESVVTSERTDAKGNTVVTETTVKVVDGQKVTETSQRVIPAPTSSKPNKEVQRRNAFYNYLSKKTTVIAGKGEDDAVKDLEYEFKDLGFKFDKFTDGKDMIKIVSPSGGDEIKIELKKKDSAIKIYNFIRKHSNDGIILKSLSDGKFSVDERGKPDYSNIK